MWWKQSCFISSNHLKFSLLFPSSLDQFYLFYALFSLIFFARSLWGTDSKRLWAACWGSPSRLYEGCLSRIRLLELSEQVMGVLSRGWKEGLSPQKTIQFVLRNPGNNTQAAQWYLPTFPLGSSWCQEGISPETRLVPHPFPIIFCSKIIPFHFLTRN